MITIKTNDFCGSGEYHFTSDDNDFECTVTEISLNRACKHARRLYRSEKRTNYGILKIINGPEKIK